MAIASTPRGGGGLNACLQSRILNKYLSDCCRPKISGTNGALIILGEGCKRQMLSAVAALLLAMLWLPCQAQSIDPSRRVTWHCWLGQDAHYSIHCLEVEGDDAIESDAPAATIFDTDRPHRELLAEIPSLAWLAIMDPAAYGGRLILIPLYNYPFSMERVSLLARSVLCGRDPLCSVRFEAAAP